MGEPHFKLYLELAVAHDDGEPIRRTVVEALREWLRMIETEPEGTPGLARGVYSQDEFFINWQGGVFNIAPTYDIDHFLRMLGSQILTTKLLDGRVRWR